MPRMPPELRKSALAFPDCHIAPCRSDGRELKQHTKSGAPQSTTRPCFLEPSVCLTCLPPPRPPGPPRHRPPPWPPPVRPPRERPRRRTCRTWLGRETARGGRAAAASLQSRGRRRAAGAGGGGEGEEGQGERTVARAATRSPLLRAAEEKRRTWSTCG